MRSFYLTTQANKAKRKYAFANRNTIKERVCINYENKRFYDQRTDCFKGE